MALDDPTIEEYVAEVERLRAGLLATRDRLGFSENDARTGYFNGVANGLANYAATLTLIHLARLAARSGFTMRIDGQLVTIEDSIVPRVIRALFENYNKGGETLFNSYMGKQKGQLFQATWGPFEDMLRCIYRSDAVPLGLRQQDEATERERYKKEPKRVHLGFAPVVWQRLSSLTAANGTTREQRRHHAEAVDFLSSARNTIHSNTFFEGDSEKTLQLGDQTLRLVPGEPMAFLYPATVLEIVRRLSAAFEFICTNVRCAAEIPTPLSGIDPAALWPEPVR